MLIGLSLGAFYGSIMDQNLSVTIGIGFGLGTLAGFIIDNLTNG